MSDIRVFGSNVWSFFYKYMTFNKNVAKTIRDRSFFLQHPENFNDPNEFEIIVDELDEYSYYSNEQDVVSDIIDFMGDVYIRHQEVPEDDQAAIRECLGKIYRTQGKERLDVLNNEVKPYIERYFIFLLDEWRVTCFSRSNDNQLMWSHYADGMKGVCLGFELSRISGERLTQVNYPLNNLKPRVNIWDLCKEDGYFRTKPLRTKHKSWSYENEWRIIERNKYHMFSEKDFRQIYFGYKSNPEDVAELIESLVSDYNFHHVKFCVSFPTPEIYGIEHLPLSRDADEARKQIMHVNSVSRNKEEVEKLMKGGV